jgi:hypothetical protein
METANPTGADDISVAAGKIQSLLTPESQSEPDPKGEEATEQQETVQTQEATPEPEAPEVKAEKDKEEGEANAELETLEELAEATGLPLEKLLNLKARAKVNGEESVVPLSEIVKSYQQEKVYTQKSMELAEQRKAFEAERQTHVQELTNRVREASALSQIFEQNLLAEYNSVNWTQLRNTDPAEFAARKQEYNDKFGQLQMLKQNIYVHAQQAEAEQAKKFQEQIGETLKKESSLMLDAIPEWKDTSRANAEKAEIGGYLKGLGFTDQEIGSVVDHRHVKLIRNAMLYEKANKAASIQQKKVLNLPKVLKSGTTPAKSDKQQEQLKADLSHLRKTGKVDDAAKIIERMLK